MKLATPTVSHQAHFVRIWAWPGLRSTPDSSRSPVRERRRAALVRQFQSLRLTPFMSTYGSFRMTRQLIGRGIANSQKTTAKVINHADFQVDLSKRFFPCTADSNRPHPLAPNLIECDMALISPPPIGRPTLPSFRPMKAGCIWWVCSTVAVETWWVGVWR